METSKNDLYYNELKQTKTLLYHVISSNDGAKDKDK